MSTTTTEIDQGLRAWAQGLYPAEAAVELLIRTNLARRVAMAVDDAGEGRRWWIDWPKAMESAGTMSGGERRILAIACSLGSTGIDVNLSDAISGLGVAHVRLVLAALDHAAGARERTVPVIVEDEAGRPVLNPQRGRQVAPFVAWPDVEQAGGAQ